MSNHLETWKIAAMERVTKDVRFWMSNGHTREAAALRVRLTTSLAAPLFAAAVGAA